MDSTDTDSECDLDFANLDLKGVDFDDVPSTEEANSNLNAHDTEVERLALTIEMASVTNRWTPESKSTNNKTISTSKDAQEHMSKYEELGRLNRLASLLEEGKYVDVLRSDLAMELLGGSQAATTKTGASSLSTSSSPATTSVWNMIRQRLLSRVASTVEFVEVEFLGIAAFQLFLQLNYTGPALDLSSTQYADINPHSCFRERLHALDESAEVGHTSLTAKRQTQYINAVLAELACDGQWPCQVVEGPYFLLLARCIFQILSNPTTSNKTWMVGRGDLESSSQGGFHDLGGGSFPNPCKRVVSLWSARATVAHERLLLTREPTVTLWDDVEQLFLKCKELFQDQPKNVRSMVVLEYGLACHHFARQKQAKRLFLEAKDLSGLFLEVTGAQGKRTKFQIKATAQLVVRAASAQQDGNTIFSDKINTSSSNADDEKITSQMIGFSDDGILHERVQFEEKEENEIQFLSILDQAILLGLCLDIKDNNPADRLTAEEMSAFLARVLCHHDDWIVYSTALLERAWLEFEGNHTKERSILQMQALADQHTERLTITQSTKKSIEDSSPVQDRLKNLHSIVYPPRWQMLRDAAERYAQLGIVTSAAEIFTEIEAWDEVVDCYRRGGKEKRAEEIVRERLAISETPRMWTALGDITNEPEHYFKAIELSHGRFSQAYISLGKFYFDSGELGKAVQNYRQALRLRPLVPSIWFRVGTISMQLEDWSGALGAFTEVVQQHPEESEAWANVAAIHMRNKNAAAAYPALNESLKYDRNNWRVWTSKLYTCLDLCKFDEATQACHVLLDLRASKSSQGIPDLEERCIKAIVGGSVEKYIEARENADSSVALESARRSLTRVHELLDRLRMSSSAPWVFETSAFLHEQVGQDQKVYENLMKEYRSLTSVRAWEKDDHQIIRVCRTVSQIVHYQQNSKDEVAKSRFLLSNVIKKVQQSRANGRELPEEVKNLQNLLDNIISKD